MIFSPLLLLMAPTRKRLPRCWLYTRTRCIERRVSSYFVSFFFKYTEHFYFTSTKLAAIYIIYKNISNIKKEAIELEGKPACGTYIYIHIFFLPSLFFTAIYKRKKCTRVASTILLGFEFKRDGCYLFLCFPLGYYDGKCHCFPTPRSFSIWSDCTSLMAHVSNPRREWVTFDFLETKFNKLIKWK